MAAADTAANDSGGDEFSWEEYFHRTGFLAVDSSAFDHVECSLQRLPPNDNSDSSAAVDADTNKTAVELIETGRFVDVQDDRDPRRVWPAEILDNVGGRLLLKFVALQDAGAPFWEFYLSERVHAAGLCDSDFGRELGLHYALPNNTCCNPGLVPSPEIVQELVDCTKSHTLDATLFQGRPKMQPHQFDVEMCLEAVDPLGGSLFYPAKVVAILNNYYFVIKYDTSMSAHCPDLTAAEEATIQRTCHARTPGLYPIGFAGQRGLAFAAPDGFDWPAYLRIRGGRMATESCFSKGGSDDRFAPGRRLEAVNPSAPHQICAATIVRKIEDLLWLHLDSPSYLTQDYIVDRRSTNLFPCGWCASNGYLLKSPYEHSVKDFNLAYTKSMTEYDKYSSTASGLPSTPAPTVAYMPKDLLPGTDCLWAPSVYVTRCFTGPHVCRNRLSMKPAQIGPGPMIIVLKSVAENLLSSASRQRELLSELNADQSPDNVLLQPVEVKIKNKFKRWRGLVDFCTDPYQIPEWCRQLCIRLGACPGLLAFKPYSNDKCPFDCNRISRTKVSGFVKPLSDLAAKRLKTRLAIQKKRQDAWAARSRQPRDSSSLHLTMRKPRTRARRTSNFVHNLCQPGTNRPMTRRARLAASDYLDDGRNGSTVKLSTQSTGLYNGHSADGLRHLRGIENGSNSIFNYAGSGNYTRCRTRHQMSSHGDSDSTSSSPRTPLENGCLNDDDVWFSGDSLDECRTAEGENHRARTVSAFSSTISIPAVDTNPLHWTPAQLRDWLCQSIVNAGVADQLMEELVDGQAFMLMDMHDVQEYLGLKLGPALKLCGVIKELKTVFLKQHSDLSLAKDNGNDHFVRPPCHNPCFSADHDYVSHQ